MINPKPLYALASFLILTVALPGCATYRECGFNGCPGDAKISANVQTLLDLTPEFGTPHSIAGQTINHVVYLNGFVSAGLESETAESVAGEAPDVGRGGDEIAGTH